LAACGAQVAAFDLSPVSVAKTQRRAELNGLADRITVDVRTAGQTGYEPASFDVVVGIAVLHHLHTMLPEIYQEVAQLLKPGGTACFIEPVANSPLLRALRRIIPVKRYATEDEIQLVYGHLQPLRSYFASVEIFHFYCLERLYRILGNRVRKPLRWFDHQAQRFLPFLRRFYGQVLVIARR
jgi:SAM-dependent methyltransferase